VSSDFGFLSAVGNTNTLITVAKMNASQELTALSYQTIGDAIYKQSQQQINGEKHSQASAQKILLSEQFDYKLTEPDDRLFIYAEY
jgi:Spy/CpxP family protein refolding chaperone